MAFRHFLYIWSKCPKDTCFETLCVNFYGLTVHLTTIPVYVTNHTITQPLPCPAVLHKYSKIRKQTRARRGLCKSPKWAGLSKNHRKKGGGFCGRESCQDWGFVARFLATFNNSVYIGFIVSCRRTVRVVLYPYRGSVLKSCLRPYCYRSLVSVSLWSVIYIF